MAAASELFAERGFHRTTVRDIAARARVNVAAGHYHYGSKRALYLAVLRAQFADVRATLQARGAAVPVTRRLLGVPAYPRGLARELAAHITAFSLGGMERVAGRSKHAR